jgi:hypothetical protein
MVNNGNCKVTVEGLFVPGTVAGLNCVSAFNLWASHTSALNDMIYNFLYS